MAFRLPTRLSLAPGSLTKLVDIVPPASRVLLVYDAGLRETPWPLETNMLLQQLGCKVITFDAVKPNPRHTTVDELAERVRAQPVDCVIGLGGGSVLDTAKAVAMLANNEGDCLEFEGKNKFSNPSLPFIAIPTTCGTGSEVTWVSVISHTEQRRKLSIKGDGMFPTYALVDADLIATLPAKHIAYTGLDALTHALEAYTGNQANPTSDALAEKAIQLLVTYLRRAHADVKGDAEAREAVMRASTLAGIAFGNADVGAVHCLSETLGGFYDVPHGLANAMLLAPVMRSHGESVESRLAVLYEMMQPGTGQSTKEKAAAFLDTIDALVTDLHIPGFDSLQVPHSDFTSIALGAVENNSNNANPRPMDEGAYLDILHDLSA